MNDKAKYIDMFIEEAREQLQNLNQVILDMEKKGVNDEYVNSAYRIVHTIKGSASVLGIEHIRDLAHTMEDLFDSLRESEEKLTDEMINLLFRSLDSIEKMIHELSTNGKIRTKGHEIIKQMQGLICFDVNENNDIPADRNIDRDDDFILTLDQKNLIMESLQEGYKSYEIEISFDKKLRFKEGRVFQLLKILSSIGYVISSLPDTNEISDNLDKMKILFITREGVKSIKKHGTAVTGIRSINIIHMDQDAIPEKTSVGPVDDDKVENIEPKDLNNVMRSDTVRVKSKLLDQLLDLVGEIMISNIRVHQIASDLKQRELKQVLKNSDRLIGELQDTVLRTRMVPVDHIFKRFPRMVRDMAKEKGKEVEFNIIGNDIEIDRSLLDEIGDALVHLLRNSVDHGFESVNERMQNGKKAVCNLQLVAYREQSNIVITVEDDGKGIDLGKIKDKAVQKGLVTKDEAEILNDKQVFQLAFLPGVSTAQKITEISGRGVGLDAVKTKIESLGGTVRLESTQNRGTKFTIKLPPSMSIISAMLVEINGENYAIPLENLSETTKVTSTDVHEFSKNGMFRLREEVLPLLNIHAEFGGKLIEFNGELPVLIVEKDENRAGLIVSRFIGQQEIVVKNLGKDLRDARFFSGATILGDGNVALILDVGALI